MIESGVRTAAEDTVGAHAVALAHVMLYCVVEVEGFQRVTLFGEHLAAAVYVHQQLLHFLPLNRCGHEQIAVLVDNFVKVVINITVVGRHLLHDLVRFILFSSA